MGPHDAVDRVIDRSVQDGKRARGLGGGVLSARIAFKAAVFQSVTTSPSAMDAILKDAQKTRVFRIGCVFIRCSFSDK